MVTHKLRWLLVGLLCLALWPGKSHGQSSELLGAFNWYSELYEQGRYQEALPFAEKALRLGKAEFGLDHPHTANLLNNLALLYHAQGHYAEAEPLHQRSPAILERALGADVRSIFYRRQRTRSVAPHRVPGAAPAPLLNMRLPIREVKARTLRPKDQAGPSASAAPRIGCSAWIRSRSACSASP